MLVGERVGRPGRWPTSLLIDAPLQALTTALAGTVLLVALRRVVRASGWTSNEPTSIPPSCSERASGARWIIAVAFLVLAGAFFRTQILQHEKYQLRAEINRLRPVPLPPPRGAILDRKGEVIAENVPGLFRQAARHQRRLAARGAAPARDGACRSTAPASSDIVRRCAAARGTSRRVVFGEAILRDGRAGWRSIARCCRAW